MRRLRTPRGLPLALALLLLLPLATVQGSTAPPPGSVWTVFTTVQAEVEGNYAIVRVIADIGNRGPDPEFPFQVRVPDDAFVTGLTIERDGETHVAALKPRDEARQEYDAWKAQEQTGGLVEKTRRSSVYAYLVNVAEFTSVRATLTYERHLLAHQGVHDLALEAPVSGFGQDLGARFEVLVRDADVAWGEGGRAERAADGWRVTREVGPRPDDAATPWTVSYQMAATPDAGEIRTTLVNGTGYFTHRLRAAPDAAQLPLDLVLVLDVSGSMQGQKIEQLRDAAAQAVRRLGPEDRLHLALFSSDVVSPWDGLRPMTTDARRGAADEVANLIAGGGTNVEAGLRRALDALRAAAPLERETRLQVVALLSDGHPTAGATDPAALRALAHDAQEGGARVYAIAFGGDASWSLMFDLAREGGGAALRVPEGEGAEVDLSRFLGALATPVLRDVRVDYGPGVDALDAEADVLLAGSEMLVVGTFDPALGLAGTLRARAPDGPREVAFAAGEPGTHAFVPRLVAHREIRHLQDLEDTQGSDPGRVERIVDLALAHGFVTDHTSLVLTLPARDMRGEPRTAFEMGDATASRPVPAPTSPTWAAANRALLTSSPETGGLELRHHGGTPGTTPEVPGPGALAALAVLALAALALRARRRGE